MGKQIFSATIFFNARPPAKYRTINNLRTFTAFAKALGGIYFNLYDKETKAYIKRITL